MRKLFVILIFALAGIFTASCEYEMIVPIEVETPDNVSFSNDVIPIFDQCLTCHSGANEPNLASTNVYNILTTGTDDDGAPYIDIQNPEQSSFYTKLSQDDHYPDITAEELATLLGWIEQGAPNN